MSPPSKLLIGTQNRTPSKSQFLKKQLQLGGKKGGSMEGKRAAASTLFYFQCMLAMLSVSVSSHQQQQQQHQMAGFAGFCLCFGDCSHGCRDEGRPRWLCTVKCVEACAIDDSSHDVPAAAAVLGAGDCSTICLADAGAADTGDRSTDANAAACVDDCTGSWNTYKNRHA